MDLQITIPDGEASRVLDAICARYGYDSEGEQTAEAFLTGQIKAWLTSEVLTHEQEAAAAAAIRDAPVLEL